jgi:hypothetical protein
VSRPLSFPHHINVDAIEEAKNGVYQKIKMIENEANYRELKMLNDFSKYYETDGKTVKMNADLISHTKPSATKI